MPHGVNQEIVRLGLPGDEFGHPLDFTTSAVKLFV
jgi:hypothetical protein